MPEKKIFIKKNRTLNKQVISFPLEFNFPPEKNKNKKNTKKKERKAFFFFEKTEPKSEDPKSLVLLYKRFSTVVVGVWVSLV
jgi:hypothetical protein